MRRSQYRDGGKLAARQRLHRDYAQTALPWQRFVFQQLRLPAHSRILEVGCGPGALWGENLQLIPGGWRITLTDLSPGMLEEAERALSAISPQLTMQVADARELPFGAASFDAVIANHMLYHVPDRPAAVAEFHRVLAPGGLLLAATNGPGHLREMRELARLVHPADTGLAESEFDLATGPPQLQPWFSRMGVVRKPGWLAVTDAEPVLDYLGSLPGRPLGRAAAERVRKVVDEAISREGCWRVQTEAGVIRGRRRARLRPLPCPG